MRASSETCVSPFVREGMSVVALGLVVGAVSAAGLTRLMQSLLVGIEPLDALSFAIASAALVIVALVASAIPARRAAATDPAIALRSE